MTRKSDPKIVSESIMRKYKDKLEIIDILDADDLISSLYDDNKWIEVTETLTLRESQQLKKEILFYHYEGRDRCPAMLTYKYVYKPSVVWHSEDEKGPITITLDRLTGLFTIEIGNKDFVLSCVAEERLIEKFFKSAEALYYSDWNNKPRSAYDAPSVDIEMNFVPDIIKTLSNNTENYYDYEWVFKMLKDTMRPVIEESMRSLDRVFW